MFRRLRDAIERALSRLEGDEVTRDDLDRVIAAMREELIERKAAIPQLEANVRAAEKEKAAERRRAEDCVRRADQAGKIGDAETVRVAEEFAKRYLARVEVLERKIAAARAELAQERDEVARMTEALKEAISRRDVLLVQARRARAMDRAGGGAREAIEELERIFERSERPAEMADARRELEEALGGRAEAAAVDRELDRAGREAEADAMLSELKRRMGIEEE